MTAATGHDTAGHGADGTDPTGAIAGTGAAATPGNAADPAGVVLDGPTILANARAVAAVLHEEAAENEQLRHLTPRAVETLRATGAFRMAMPRAWGGPEVDVACQIEIVEALARADGSAGWCAMIGSDGGFYTAALDDAAGRALYPDLDAVTAGWIQPGGQLHAVDGGYLLSGQWQFASACRHADVLVGGAIVFADGARLPGDGGIPEIRVAMLPAEQFQILDTWHTTGLAGSGSHDYTIDGAFVPAAHTFRWDDDRREGALYAWPGLFAVDLLGVPLGIGRAALDAAEALLAEKILMPEMRPARDEARVRTGVARAEAMVGSARSYLFDVVGDFWATLVAGAAPSRRQRAALAGCYPHVTRACREAAELLADTVGSASIFRSCPLERHRRDLVTISQHVLAQPKFLETVGGLWLDGADVDHPLVRQRVF